MQPISANKQPSYTSTQIVLLVLAIAVLGPFAADSFLPSLPAMVQVFGSTKGVLQLTIALYLLGLGTSQLLYGPLSDGFGRRRIILLGLSIAVLAGVFSLFIDSVALLLCVRFMQGAGIGACVALYRAIMRDEFSGDRLAEVISFSSIFFAITPLFAPIVGGYVQTSFGWRGNFVLIASLTVCIWLLVWFYLPETNKKLNPSAIKIKTLLNNYALLLTNKIFMGYSCCMAIAFSGFIAYCSLSPFLFQNVLGLSPKAYGWMSAYIFVGSVIGRFLNGWLIAKLGMQRMMQIGMGIMMISGLVMYVIGLFHVLNVAVVMIPTLFFVLGCSFIYANAMAGAFTPFAAIAGTAGALLGCIQMVGSFIVSLLVTRLHTDNQLSLALIYIFLSVLCFATFYYFIVQSGEEQNNVSADTQ